MSSMGADTMASPAERESIGDAAARETVTQLIGLGFAVLTIVMHRKLTDPDAMRIAKMYSSLVVKRWADRQAERFIRLSDHMATVYNGEKL